MTMKKCPFCAEEIQDEAIKCRYCGSFMSSVAPAPNAAILTPPIADSPEASPAVGGAAILVPALADPTNGTPSSPVRKVLYAGSPSWRAYFRAYAGLVIAACVVPYTTFWIAAEMGTTGFNHILSFLIPVGLVLVGALLLRHYRRSRVFRVTSSNIEVEYGFLSKKIDVLELWRCRDIQYRQSLFDRILSIAHIDIYTTDVTTPQVCIVGLPASRELFENIRDAIEIQRQSRNVVGMIQ